MGTINGTESTADMGCSLELLFFQRPCSVGFKRVLSPFLGSLSLLTVLQRALLAGSNQISPQKVHMAGDAPYQQMYQINSTEHIVGTPENNWNAPCTAISGEILPLMQKNTSFFINNSDTFTLRGCHIL